MRCKLSPNHPGSCAEPPTHQFRPRTFACAVPATLNTLPFSRHGSLPHFLQDTSKMLSKRASLTTLFNIAHMHIHTHSHMLAHLHSHVHISTWTQPHTCVCTCSPHVHMCTNTHSIMPTLTYIYAHTYTHSHTHTTYSPLPVFIFHHGNHHYLEMERSSRSPGVLVTPWILHGLQHLVKCINYLWNK